MQFSLKEHEIAEAEKEREQFDNSMKQFALIDNKWISGVP